MLFCTGTQWHAYLAVLRSSQMNNDSTLVVKTHVPEICDCVLDWQLSRYERRFTLETLHTESS